MIPRKMLEELRKSASEYRVVTLIGPRQAGKSTLVRHAFPDYRSVSLEDPDVRELASTDPRGFLNTYDCFVIIDEIQRVPSLLSYLQTKVDNDPIPGSFILTGSHQLELREAVGQSLAGRTALLTLLPLSSEEVTVTDVYEQIWQGMMPAVHAQKLRPRAFFRNYFQTYLERDVRKMINLKDSVQFEKFVRLTAGRAGSLVNHSSLAGDVGVSVNTIKEWLAILEASFLLFRLPPYFNNFGKRVIKSPKIYFTDTGLLCWLLGIENSDMLKRDRMRGHLFENYVVLEAWKARANWGLEPRLFFFRDSQGNEVDLLLEKERQLRGFEVKSAETFHKDFCKGLDKLMDLAGADLSSREVIYGGDTSLKLSNCDVTPVAKMDVKSFL